MAGSFRWLTVLLLALGLSACGGDDHSAGSTEAPAAEGRAVKGVLQGAQVTAYAFDEDRKPTRFLATTLTDGQGYFSFPELPAELIRLVIEAAPDGSSTMLCDAADGCGDGVAFGQPMALPEDFQLVSLLPADRPEGSVAVTPLTHIAALWAEQFPLGVTDQTATLALSQVAAVFGLDANFAWQTPIDVTNPDELAAAAGSAQTHGFLSAAFAQLGGGTNAQQIIAEYVQAFIDNGGQLPVGEGGANLQALAGAAESVAQKFADGEMDLTTLIGSLQSVYTRWSGPLTVVSGSSGFDEAAMARAMAPLNDLDSYLRTAGIDESGSFLASQKHQLDWLYTQHTLDLAEVSLGSALTVIQAAVMTDLLLSQIPSGFPLPPTLPIDVQGMPELSAVVAIATRQLVISGVHNGQTVNVTVDLAPLIAGLSAGELSYSATASVSNSEITGQL
ncbi:MAG: carboxypeptidase-like regulatory domain-containing protein, partial [Alcanivoracaceae bacterium]|nr:carboxypeptidase-like regulatory domain-containing protein [Alcanivoracaceae bacterium]